MSIALMIISGLVGIFVIYTVYAFRRLKNVPDVMSSDKIKILTDKNFEHQVRFGVSLVDFWASWCVPCKMMSPVLNELAEEINGRASICKLNVEQFQAAATRYAVRNIPTMVLFRNGKEINRFVGVRTKDFLLKQIKDIT
jgi:thioredoxin 1